MELVLRLLPSAACSGMESSQPQRECDEGSLLSSQIAEDTSAYGGAQVRCLALPYRQRWAPEVLSALLGLLRQDALLELYHFSDCQEERAALRRHAVRGMDELCSRTGAEWRTLHWDAPGKERAADARAPRPAWLQPHKLCLTLAFRRVGGMTLEVQAAHEAHWAQVRLPEARCRTVVLADTPALARAQLEWARTQSTLSERRLPQPLLRPQERALALPLVSRTPPRRAGAEEMEAWDPWDECTSAMAAENVGRAGLARLRANAAESMQPLPPRRVHKEQECAADAIESVRRGGVRSADARAALERWHAEATREEALLLLHQAMRGEGAEHEKRAWLSAQRWTEDFRDLAEQLLCNRPWTYSAEALRLLLVDQEDYKSRCNRAVMMRLGRGGVTRVPECDQHWLAKLLFLYRNGAEAQIPVQERAAAVADSMLLQLDGVQQLQLAWLAAVGTESGEDTLAWLRALHLRVAEAPRLPLLRLCAVARFWASEYRTSKFRGETYAKRNDRQPLSTLSAFVKQLRAPPDAEAAAWWREALRREERHVALQRHCEEERNARKRAAAESWRRYSTRDPREMTGLHPCLEMLRASLARAGQLLLQAWDDALLEQECQLFVAGELSNCLWPLLPLRERFKVFLLSKKTTSDASNQPVKLRRCLYQLDARSLARVSPPPQEDAAYLECRNAVALALREALSEERADLGWWREAQLRACAPDPDVPELPVLATLVARQHRSEALHRAKLPDAGDLEQLWLRRLTLTLRQAAAATCTCVGAPVPVFAETFMNQLTRAHEEPLLRQLCQLRDEQSEQSELRSELEVFARTRLVPLCRGPAAAERLLAWLDLDALAALEPREAAAWLAHPGEPCAPCAFLEEIAPSTDFLCSIFEQRRVEAATALTMLAKRLRSVRAHRAQCAPAAFRSAFLAQLRVSEALRRARFFMEVTLRAQLERMTGRPEDEALLEHLAAKLRQAPDPLRLFLAGSVRYRCRRRLELGCALQDALAYAQRFEPEECRDLRLLRRELARTFTRGPRLAAAHALQRRFQVESFAAQQRTASATRSGATPRSAGSSRASSRSRARPCSARCAPTCWRCTGSALGPTSASSTSTTSRARTRSWRATCSASRAARSSRSPVTPATPTRTPLCRARTGRPTSSASAARCPRAWSCCGPAARPCRRASARTSCARRCCAASWGTCRTWSGWSWSSARRCAARPRCCPSRSARASSAPSSPRSTAWTSGRSSWRASARATSRTPTASTARSKRRARPCPGPAAWRRTGTSSAASTIARRCCRRTRCCSACAPARACRPAAGRRPSGRTRCPRRTRACRSSWPSPRSSGSSRSASRSTGTPSGASRTGACTSTETTRPCSWRGPSRRAAAAHT
jgi:hypothetical protein